MILLLFCPALLLSQKSIKYSEVVELKGTQTELSQKASEWVAVAYNSGKYVTQLNTKEKIIIKDW